MYLVRHNRLKSPYDDYTKLNLQQSDDLAVDRVSPDVQPLDSGLIIERFSSLTKSVDHVYSSDSKRAQQTCSAVLTICSKNIEVKTEPLLKEIYFSPIALLGHDHKQNPLQSIRGHLYSAIKQRKNGVESYELLKKRVEQVVEQYLNKNVLCFSHGFLIRLLISYQKNNFNFDDALDNVKDVAPVDYLELVKLPV